MQETAISTLRARVSAIEEEHLIYTQNAPGGAPEEAVEVTLPYGLCVWAAGTAPQPITQTLAARISAQQSESVKKTGKLQVDPWMRVTGLPTELKGSILAMGDCSVVVGGEEGALPQTAQVAAQQGAYVARLLNKGFDMSFYDAPRLPVDLWYSMFLPNAAPFKFLNLGQLAYVGGSRALAQVNLGDSELLKASGEKAYLLWKSVYLVKQVSTRSRILMFMDYLRSQMLGRDLTV